MKEELDLLTPVQKEVEAIAARYGRTNGGYLTLSRLLKRLVEMAKKEALKNGKC